MKSRQKYLNRFLLEELQKWIDRKEILAIKGPRQSGKTTVLKMLQDWLISQKKVSEKNIVFITFEERDILEKFSLDPKEYVKSLIGENQQSKFYFFIDEFQYLKNGGQVLKMLYDIFENIKFIITGSSSLELAGKTARFLVGRIFFFHLLQLDFKEFIQTESSQLNNAYQNKSVQANNFVMKGKDFPVPKQDIFNSDFEKVFQKYAIWGGYPAVVNARGSETKKIILKNIYSTYIARDIIELLKIAEYAKFKNLVSILSVQIGNLVNYNSLIQDAQSYFKEIKRYLSILEETYIISLLKPYCTNKISELKKNPKVYFIDLGLRNYLTGNMNSNLAQRQDLGAVMENAVFSQLQKKEDGLRQLKYWRTIGGAEVDFIIEKPNEIIPIEVKYSGFKSPKISRGFRNFISGHHPKRAVVLTRGYWGEMKLNHTLIKFIPLWYL